MKKILILIVSHLVIGVLGFMVGVYTLPIIIAPDAPSVEQINLAKKQVEFSGHFMRKLAGSDFLHWGEGSIFVGPKFIALEGSIAPGPDYYLYLSPTFIETESEFQKQKSRMVRVGPVKTFNNFVISVPELIEPNKFTTVVIWCETFNEFITAAKYN